jgi:DNA-binding NtrC family response regulator
MDSATGRILILDDDLSLLKVMEGYLARLGYHVDACRNATEAWDLVQADPAGYSVALLDMNMPGMRGEELARLILGTDASIQVVVVSGSPSELCALDTPHAGRVSFLRKPFAPHELAETVEKLLPRSVRTEP